ncbi:MAG: hypothetical protein DRJ05_14960 [Bacteroidetes bacterium]|nr:MAG: hypothetical protein DRJ05_14960 [Bacteroidota bacterium]
MNYNFLKDNKQTNFIVVLFFVIVNIIFKLFYIDHYSFWLDEATQGFISQKNLREIYLESLIYPNGPVYTFLLGVWMKAFGITEISTRFFSVLVSAATVPFIYFMVKKHFDVKTAIAAIAIFTLSNWQFYYAHEARSYTLVTLFVVFSFYSFFDYLKSFRKIHLVFYALSTSILLYIHLTSVLIISIQGIISLFYIRKNLLNILVLWVSMAIPVALLSIWFLNNNWFAGNETVWLSPPVFESLINMFSQYFNGRYIFYSFLVLTLVYIIKSFREKEFDKKFWGMFLWGTLPIIIIFLSSIYYNPRFTYRYMLYATIGLYISYAYLIFSLFKNKYLAYGLLIIVLVVQAFNFDPKLKRDGDWRGALDYYHSVKSDNSATILSAEYLHVPFTYYYNKDIFKDYKNIGNNLKNDNVYRGNNDKVLGHIDFSKYGQLHLILSHYHLIDPDSTLYNAVAKRYKLIDFKSFQKINFLTFDLNTIAKPDTLYYNFNDCGNCLDSDEGGNSKIAYVDENKEYSKGINRKTGFLVNNNSKKITVKAKTKYTNSTDDVAFVASIERVGPSGSKFLSYKIIDISENKTANSWESISTDIYLSGLERDDILKVYLWNKNKSKAYIKEIEIIY